MQPRDKTNSHKFLWERARELENLEKTAKEQRVELNKDIGHVLQEANLILYRTEDATGSNVYWWFRDALRNKDSKQYRSQSSALLSFESDDIDWK
jgi:hypothetical protein